VYFYGLSSRLGVDRIAAFLAPFGYGQLTGIDIDGEKPGILPSPEWKKKTYKRPQDQVWYPGETVNFGVGQGYLLITPLQLAHIVSVLAGRGENFKPRLVTGVRDFTGTVKELAPTQNPRITGISDANWNIVVKGMVGATVYGTAAASGKGSVYTMAGKTGTAQVFSVAQGQKYDEKKAIALGLRDHALFIAFAPVDHPRIAVAVLAENAGFGASVAAPIARKVMDAFLLDKDGALKPEQEPGAPPP
jgi:penicillin-binding protein 2